jgi:membrane dipeptidase
MRTINFADVRTNLISLATVAALVAAFSTGAARADDPSDAEIMEQARAIHEQALVLDGHADIIISDYSKRFFGPDGLSRVDPAKLKQGGVNAVVMSVAVGPGPRTDEGDAEARAEADAKLAAIKARADANEGIVIATTADEVIAAQANGKIAFIIGFQNARSLQKNPAAIEDFYQAGARVFGLNHLSHNAFSDSSRLSYDSATKKHEPAAEHGGLSDLGRAVIERVNALGGIVDVSQMSPNAVLQTIELSTTPVIASHSNVRALTDVNRNLSDAEIDKIGETGGVIHLAPFTAYLLDFSDPEFDAAIRALRVEHALPADYDYPYELYWEMDDPEKRVAFTTAMRALLGPATFDDLLRHLDYVIDRIGIEHVGIGTDFNHGGGFDGYADASEALNLTAAMVRHGYSAEDITKIWGGNFLRVMRAADERAATSP